MRTYSYLLAGAAALTLGGCGEERAPAPVVNPTAPAAAPLPTNNVPDWVNDPTMGGKYPIAAYGVSEKMMAGENMMRDTALQRARVELGRAIDSRIQAVFKDWTREGGEITSQDNKQMAMAMVESVSRVVTDQSVKGASQRGRWAEPGTGKLFIWSYLDPAAMDQVAQQVKSAARAEAEKRSHFASQIEADKAFADLDKLVDAKMKQ